MRIFLLLVVCVIALPLVVADPVYVDNTCSNNGNGHTTTCGANGPFNNLQSAFNTLQPGDTLYIMQGTGTYATSGQEFTIQSKSGTQQNPIRITYHPGDNPLIVNCGVNSDSSYCNHPTIFVRSSSHLIFDGIRLQGSLRMRNSQAATQHRHITVINSDLRTGWESPNEGNWAPLRLEGIHNVYVANNTFRDLNIPSGGGSHSSATYIMMFGVGDVLIEHNDFLNKITSYGPGGIYDKATVNGLVIRRNRFHHAGLGYRMGGQENPSIMRIENTLFTENLIVCPQGQQLIAEFGNRGANRSLTHNTGVNCGSAYGGTTHGHGNYDRYFYNNLAAGVTGSNWEWYEDNSFGPRQGQDIWDYNVYTPNRPFHIYDSPGYNSNFAEYQAHGYEPNSQAINCGLNSNHQFSSSSPCHTAGRVGGVSSGATVPVGAFAFTDCVGRDCPHAEWTHPEVFTGASTPPPPDPIPVNGACGTRSDTFAHDTTSWPSGSNYCSSGTPSSTPSFPNQGNSLQWNCQGSNGGTTTSCSALREDPPPEDENPSVPEPPESPDFPEGVVLVNETFENTNFESRGWYDYGGFDIDTSQAAPGSTRSARYRLLQGQSSSNDVGTNRVLFDETETLYFSYWVKYSDNWVGSQQNYHPHEFHFVTNYDSQWVGPGNSHLTFYVEQVGGTPFLFIQDNQNIDADCVRVNGGQIYGCDGDFDSYEFTEERSAASCNGALGEYTGTDCYPTGGGNFYSAKGWDAPTQVFSNTQGPYYKGDWHHIEVYAEMNSIENGVGIPDGKLRYWFDGELLISTDQAFLRTGARADQAFEQLIVAPYIGDGSPIDQTMWVDNLVVATAPPGEIEEPEPPQERPGDITGNNRVELDDLFIVVSNLGRASGDSNFDARADLNGDGAINIFDLVIIAQLFGMVYE